MKATSEDECTWARQLAWFLRLRPQGRFLLDGDFGVPEREPPSGATIVRSQRPTMRVVEYLEAAGRCITLHESRTPRVALS